MVTFSASATLRTASCVFEYRLSGIPYIQTHVHMSALVLTEIQMQLGSGLVGASNNWLKGTI